MATLDFKTLFKDFYSPSSKTPEIVDLPAMRYLMTDGCGDPNGSEQFDLATGALYSIAYTAKFDRKRAGIGPDYLVGALEGLWWTGDNLVFDLAARAHWRWTIMLWLPECVTQSQVADTIERLRLTKPNPMYESVRLEGLQEGQAAQIMHVGPYAEEGPTIARLDAYVDANGYSYHGKHHEIYLGAPRRTKPDRLKTIIRHPVVAKQALA